MPKHNPLHITGATHLTAPLTTRHLPKHLTPQTGFKLPSGAATLTNSLTINPHTLLCVPTSLSSHTLNTTHPHRRHITGATHPTAPLTTRYLPEHLTPEATFKLL